MRRAADYWGETADTLQVLPRIRSSALSSHSAAVRAVGDCMADIFDRFFVVPEVPGWCGKMAFYTQICDITFADAVRGEGHISEQRVTEAATLARTYLAFYLPTWLPARNR